MPANNDVSVRFMPLLLASEWSPDRRVDIRGCVQCLEREGYNPNPTACCVLESFLGISVVLPPSEHKFYEHELSFDPVRAASGEADRAQQWHQEIGVQIFPIGEEVRTGNIIWAGDDGRFYYGHGFGLYLLGESFEKAMDQLAFAEQPFVRCAD